MPYDGALTGWWGCHSRHHVVEFSRVGAFQGDRRAEAEPWGGDPEPHWRRENVKFTVVGRGLLTDARAVEFVCVL